MSDKYVATIGIECHVQLSTKTKLFTAVDNDARDKDPNTTVSPICFGLPGTLPVLNIEAVNYGIRAGLALNAEINPVISFDRKHYFYPDLPKGYQITQMYQPIILGGYVELPGLNKKVRIHHAHLEEDAGKNTHPSGVSYSLVDLNRAGTPLLEIVSEPDMHSAEEARTYAHELYLIMKYARVSDVDLYQGNMRFDVNVSVALADANELGVRTETKNLNSFKSIERAVNYEIRRQTELLEKGETVIQETRGWDDAKQKTTSQRGKEFAHDYRYMPEPDVPPFQINQDMIDHVKAGTEGAQIISPAKIRQQLLESGVQAQQVETLLEQPLLLEILLNIGSDDKKATQKIASWLVVDVVGMVEGDSEIKDVHFKPKEIFKLYQLLSDNKLSSTGAKEVLSEMLVAGGNPELIAQAKNLIQQSDEGEIEAIIDNVLAENESAANDVRNGEMKAIGFLVGQVMKQSGGKANPQIVNKLLRDKLSQ